MNRKRRIDKGSLIIYILILICFCGIGYSSFNITKWYLDSTKTQKKIDAIQDVVEMEEISGGDIEDINTENIEDSSPYWTYIKLDLISVDFKKLKRTNNDIVGWLNVPGTNINYPFMHTTDNEYYLHHSIDKSYNSAGWLFMDYRNDPGSIERNNIIYAHGRRDQTMFGSLKNTLNSSWTSNPDNFVVKVSTEKINTLWQVFSIYHLPTTADYIQVSFDDDNEFLTWLDLIKGRSEFNFNVDLSANDKIITLSTCYNSTDKMVLHARLIKSYERK